MNNNSFDWKDKVVAITGGSSGKGKAIAIEAKARGAKVSVCDINKNNLDEVSKEFGFLTLYSDVGKKKK